MKLAPRPSTRHAKSSPARALFAGLFDDAALFPPAALSMDEALREHDLHRRGPRGWALGRFVVPVGRLEELAARLEALPPDARGDGPWRLTAIAGREPLSDAKLVVEFNARHGRSLARIQSFEAVLGEDGDAGRLRRALPADIALALELPREEWRDEILDERLGVVQVVGATAKMRAGGTRAEDVPSPAAVFTFLEACAGLRLPFKATAGLHHPVRGPAALGYEPDGGRATMHGYLNLLLAATLLWHGRAVDSARHLLESEDRHAFRFVDGAVQWHSQRIVAAEVAETRRDFAIAIGSCSFREPVEEFEALGPPLEEAT